MAKKLLAAVLFVSCRLGAAEHHVVIEDVAVVDVVTATIHPHQNIVISGERIAAIGGAIPAGARIVNGRGRFAIPGLWDMHVHLPSRENPLPTYLAFGVTGIRDMGSDFARTSERRHAIESGSAIGPRVVTAGPAVDGADGGTEPVIVARNAPEARRAFDRLWNMNVDFIGVEPGLPRDSYIAVAEMARHWHLPIEGEIPASVSAFEAIEARQASLENLGGILRAVSTDGEAIDLFEKCAVRGISIVPTLVQWREPLKNDPRLKYVPASVRRSWTENDVPPTAKQRDDVYRLVSLATRTKVRVMAGTGTGSPYTIPGATLHDELEQMVAAGMTANQALRSATIEPAAFLGLDDDLGTVEKGKFADVVLLEANPLADIRNVRRIAAVIARGKLYARKDLDSILGAVN